jgi:hypothetical protein
MAKQVALNDALGAAVAGLGLAGSWGRDGAWILFSAALWTVPERRLDPISVRWIPKT